MNHNPLGIFNTVFRELPLREMAAKVRSHGLHVLHLDPYVESVCGGEPLTPAKARQIRGVLENQGLQAAALCGYMNLMDRNRERKQWKLGRFERLIELCHEFGTSYIATETGSLNPESEWDDHPANHTSEARQEMLEILGSLRDKARKHGVTILIEGYVNNVVATTEEAVRLLDDLGADGLGFVMDPFNYFTPHDMDHQEEALERIFAAIAARAPIAHAKDVVYRPDGTIATPKVGAGQLDWTLYAKQLRMHAPRIPLILEHLKPEDVEPCKALVIHAFESAA